MSSFGFDPVMRAVAIGAVVILAFVLGVLAGSMFGFMEAAGSVTTVTIPVKCTHGESSAFATIGKDGKIHQSKPVVTGCVP